MKSQFNMLFSPVFLSALILLSHQGLAAPAPQEYSAEPASVTLQALPGPVTPLTSGPTVAPPSTASTPPAGPLKDAKSGDLTGANGLQAGSPPPNSKAAGATPSLPTGMTPDQLKAACTPLILQAGGKVDETKPPSAVANGTAVNPSTKTTGTAAATPGGPPPRKPGAASSLMNNSVGPFIVTLIAGGLGSVFL